MAYAQCPKCHARLRVPDSRQSVHVRCPGCSHAFQTRPGAREEAAPTSGRAGGMRPLMKWMLAAWAIVAIGATAGGTYLLVTDTGSTQAPVPDEPAAAVTAGEGATPLVGAGETTGEPDGLGDASQPHPSDGIDETKYHQKADDPKPPKKPRKPGRKRGRGKRKSKTSQSGDDPLEKTDISGKPRRK